MIGFTLDDDAQTLKRWQAQIEHMRALGDITASAEPRAGNGEIR